MSTLQRSPEESRQVHLAMANIQVELDKLSKKRSLSKQEARRFDMLLQRASNLKAGFGLAEVLQSEANREFAERGLEEVRFHSSAFESRSAEDREDSRQIREWLFTGKIEKRAETVGVANFVYFSGNAGSLVPTKFLKKIVRTMAQHSPLFDPDNVTYIDSEDGAPLQVPYFSDIENVATVIGEAVDDSGAGTGISNVAGTHIVTYNYRTPRILISLEADQDVPQLDELLGTVMSDRFARGAGIDLLYGSGTNKMLGLIPSLQAAGVNPTIAAGSSVNDGSGNTGTNSIGVQDILNLLYSCAAPYRASGKFAFLMNSTTALFISKLTDKQGRPLLDINADVLRLYGKQVLIDEGMEGIGSGQIPVIAGDLSFWATRVASGTMSIRRCTEGVGLIENGLFAVNLWGRIGGALLYSDTSAPSPVQMLQCHS